MSEIRVGEALRRIVAKHVLRAQFAADLLEGFIQTGRAVSVIVFPAGVASGAGCYWNNNNAVNDCRCLLGGTNGFGITGLADGVSTVSDDDHHLPSLAV